MTFAGLCEACRHVRAIENRRGSRFLFCALSRVDPRFPRYPRLPVLTCAGFQPVSRVDEDASLDTGSATDDPVGP